MPPPGYEPFLRAICADPEDDIVRLVYADWLDENGDPARAEFIRLSVACFREPPSASADPRWIREEELLNAHREEWATELSVPSDLWSSGWSRGFPELVVVRGEESLFLSHAAAIVEHTPVRSLHLASLSNPIRTLRALAACPYTRYFRAVGIVRTRLIDEGLEVIANSPNFAGVRYLSLWRHQVSDRGMIALLNSPHTRGLEKLSLGYEGERYLSAEVRELLRERFGPNL